MQDRHRHGRRLRTQSIGTHLSTASVDKDDDEIRFDFARFSVLIWFLFFVVPRTLIQGSQRLGFGTCHGATA